MVTTRVVTHALDWIQKLKISNEVSLSGLITQAPPEESGKSGRLFSSCKGGHGVLVEFPRLPKDTGNLYEGVKWFCTPGGDGF